MAECPSYIESAYKSGVVGDIDTINSLRIADTLDSDATQRAVNEASTITRSDARALTKQLKSGPTSEAVDGPTHPVTDTAAPDQTDDTQDQEREPPETTTPSPQREKTAPKTDKTPKTQPTGQPCGIRVRVDGDVGVIDMNGQAQAGEIVIVLDNANGTLTVPASDVELLGYAFDA